MPPHISGNNCSHNHHFNKGNPLAERNTRRAALLTVVMMVAEIVCGYVFNSMALLADGWHMGSHALALGLATLAYVFSRRLAHDPRFTFGTWKIEVLASYTSALFLLGIALLMFFESFSRLINPVPIRYDQAIGIAVLGLLVNLICAWLLKGSHHHEHDDEDTPQHYHHHHDDLNLRAAYIHVLTDAATSILAIIALLGGKYWGADWLDPFMGIAGGILIAVWAKGLLRETGRILLDAEMDTPIVTSIRKTLEADSEKAQIRDLHVWRVEKNKYACILSLVVDEKSAARSDHFRRLLSIHKELVHMTIEIDTPETAAPDIAG